LGGFFGEQWVGYFCSFHMRHLVKLMVDKASCTYDMLHFNMPNHERVGDEASVAPPGQSFSTHQRQAVLSDERDDF
jgi:hypothetical protein